MTKLKTAMIATAIGLGLLAMGSGRGVAFAQASSGGDSGVSATASGNADTSVDKPTLEKAAKAYMAVRKINLDTAQQLSQNTDPQQKKQIVASARSQQVNIVKQNGLSAEQYNQVLEKVDANPDLKAQFASYVKGDSSGPDSN